MKSGVLLNRGLLFVVIVITAGILRYNYNEVTLDSFGVQGDAAAYLVYGTNLLDNGTFSRDRKNDPPIPDAFWSPGYPGFLAGSLKLARIFDMPRLKFLLTAQLALGLLTILFSYLLAKEFLPGFWPLLPSALVALSPHLVAIGQNLLSETLFGCLLIFSIYFYVLGIDRNRRLYLFIAGIGFAFAWLVNPVSLLVAPLLCAAALLARNFGSSSDGPSLRQVTILLIAPLLLIVLLWTVRTAVSVPEGALKSSDRLLTNLIIGMHSDYHDIWRAKHSDKTDPATLDEAAIGGSFAKFAQVFGDRFSEEPLSMMTWYLMRKPLVLWSWDVQVGYRDIYIYPIKNPLYERSSPAIVSYVFMKHTHTLLLLFAVAGIMFLSRKQQEKRWIPTVIYLSVVYTSLVYIVTQADPRYSFPLRPELYLCATYFLASLVGIIRTRNNRGKDSVEIPSPL